jgi:hypothetical protein
MHHPHHYQIPKKQRKQQRSSLFFSSPLFLLLLSFLITPASAARYEDPQNFDCPGAGQTLTTKPVCVKTIQHEEEIIAYDANTFTLRASYQISVTILVTQRGDDLKVREIMVKHWALHILKDAGYQDTYVW